ncbi:hypothetical protein ACTNBL_13345 [Enterococcus villorum]|uniref:Uncharacterized protein n=2 Tax=Enterococcus villorum TaxID=112904 RepID=A0A511J3S7_9ENTE|nr:hypothetical protein [Enterococcus villorum]EOH92634.1 hypothetical protein UAO_00325 [Enterococcus villorum ATCC 700913]EOW75542.1 hypothetical protein I591_02635 [Enterococcus villorum ATCC 700913]GEL92668.1 hypothetical protein EVI01_20050 [Enterococcus villorum]
MKTEINKTMLAVPYIRGWYLEESRSKQLIKKYATKASVLTDQINQANGGMFTRNVATRAHYFKTVIEKKWKPMNKF